MAPDISDHALVKFLERAAGLDAAGLKRAIGASLMRAALTAGAIGATRYTVHADGLVYVVIEGVVVSVLPADAPGMAREAKPRR